MREQRREVGPSPAPDSDKELSRRLDELTRPEMERVLERAVRIHAERSDTPTFTRDQIDQVAAELGLPPAVVERAMEEEFTDTGAVEERSLPLGPRRIVERATVEGIQDEVTDRVMAWMESEEGLRPAARTPGGVRWVRDSHWATGARLALGSEGTKALLGMRQTTHRVTALSSGRQLVELEVDTSNIRVAAAWTGAGVGMAGIGGGVAAAFGIAEGSDLAQFVTVAAPSVLLGLASTLTVATAWAASVRNGAKRALDGVAHPDLYRRAARRMAKRRGSARRRSGVERLVDEVSDALDRLLDGAK